MRLLYKLLEEEEKLIGNSLKCLSTDVTSRKSEELSNSLDFTILFEYDPKIEYENLEEMNSFSIAARELELALERTKIVDNNLYIVIVENKNRLFPTFDNFESMKKWWIENGTRCIEEFRTILIEYRDIGHDWKFNKAETDSLWEYSDLNKFLIDCLQSSCLISEQLRQEIVNTLWLPICKIKSGNL
ncbi:hypothetical protein FD724_37810 (plasmid) [Nostoc sp. C057]|uniref:NACHT C-terminal helical domain 2-containing protein n=1 Tax=Nostoc sp. C057 TaxID=2576903 RepID=UPI0015C3481B|nr:hypothetical protein [Nostoc sp. C057]QLE53613.1 hypothetical protein FD724_37810 [Nostoc sp. C057]